MERTPLQSKNMNHAALRQHALDIFNAGLQAVDPVRAIEKHLKRDGSHLRVGEQSYDLGQYDQIYVVGAGKAGASMSQGLEALLGDRISAGLISTKYDHLLPTRTIALAEAGHPVPDKAGVVNTRVMSRMLAGAGENDLVFCLLSGGGSALLPAPAPGLCLRHKQEVTQQLLNCGVTIQEINTIRKHLSAVKGGQLARLVQPATLATLILSDIIGDPLDMIASGPTVPDTTTFTDCQAILGRYSLHDRIPNAVRDYLLLGKDGLHPETPKQGDPAFAKTQNLIIASNTLAAEAAAQKARELGYHTIIHSTEINGETRKVATEQVNLLKQEQAQNGQSPLCLISGGETTVTIKGQGKGGRNQEFALAAALAMNGCKNSVVFSAGTDGPTDAAGAIVDDQTVTRAQAQDLDPRAYLDNNDAYHFFEALDDLVKTGPTNTNVMDLHILLSG